MKDEEKTKEQLVEALREGEKRPPFEFMPEEEEVHARQTAELSRANERLEEKDRLLREHEHDKARLERARTASRKKQQEALEKKRAARKKRRAQQSVVNTSIL